MTPSLKQGDLVGFILKGQPQIGLLTSLKGSRAILRVAGTRREQQLASRELSVLKQKHNMVEVETSLPTISEVRKLSLNSRDLIAGWRLLEGERRKSKTSPTALKITELADLLLNKDDPIHLAALWFWLNSDQPLFRVRRDHMVEARQLIDLRRIRQLRRKQQSRVQQRLDSLALLIADTPLSKDQWQDLPSDLQLTINRLIELADGPEDAFLIDEQALELIKELKLGRSLSDLRYWLIKKGWRDPHDLTTLKGSIWTKSFEGSVQAQADQLLNKFEQLSFASDDSRLDLSDLRTYTLDDHQTQEIDDAISLQCVDQDSWIWIHIADPARLIPVDSPLDLEARARATSLYLADGLRPMLPLSVAAEVLSLRAGRRCAALSVAVVLDESGCIADTRVCRTWIRPCYRLTYEDGDELIELAPPGDEDLSTLASLLKKRQLWRERQGALLLEQSEGRFKVKDDQPELHVVESTPARRLVSEAMILMGTVIAEFGKRQNLALPYRSQPPTQLPSATDLSQLIEGPVRHAAIKRCLSRGVLGTRPMAHFSLGLSAYVQASSPIRRYADLLAHRQVVAHLGGSVPLSEHALMEQLDVLEDPLRQAQQIQREDQRHWQKVWFLKHRHEQWPALFLRWLRPQDQIALVHVECLAMDLACKLNGLIDPSPGLALIIRVLAIDPLTDQIELVAK